MATGLLGGLKRAAWHGLIVALAIGAAAFARFLALRPDPAVERFLNAPGVVARAMDSLRSRPDAAAASKSPLVVQAEAFALYLNPPAHPQRKPPAARPRRTRPQPKPVASAPKFKLLGISYYRAQPAESKALLWGPSDGYVWVRQGAQFGHLTIEEIRGRSLVCREAGQIQEIAIDSESAPAVRPVQNAPERSPPRPVEMEIGTPSLAKAEPAQPRGEEERARPTTSQGRMPIPMPRRIGKRLKGFSEHSPNRTRFRHPRRLVLTYPSKMAMTLLNCRCPRRST